MNPQKIPQGDWFCPACRPKEIVRTPRKRRRSIFEEEEAAEEIGEHVTISSVSSSEEEEEDEDEDGWVTCRLKDIMKCVQSELN